MIVNQEVKRLRDFKEEGVEERIIRRCQVFY